MPPKGSRKRAASTSQQPTPNKAAKQSRPEPVRISRRLRSASPSNHSPLRALSPPKRTRRRKPSLIPEDAQAEKQAEQEAETQTTNEAETVDASQDTNGAAGANEHEADHDEHTSQDGNVHPSIEEPVAGDNESSKEVINGRNESEHTQSVAQNGKSQPTTETSGAEDVVQIEAELQQAVEEPAQSENEPPKHNEDDFLEHNEQNSEEHDEDVHRGHNQAESLDQAEDHPMEIQQALMSPPVTEPNDEPQDIIEQTQGPESQLYTSKEVSPFSETDSKTSSLTSHLHPISSKDPKRARSTSPRRAASLDISLPFPNDVISCPNSGSSKPGHHVFGNRRELTEKSSYIYTFEIHSDRAYDMSRELTFMIRDEHGNADIYKVQHQATQKRLESQQIRLQRLQEEAASHDSPKATSTPRSKRPLPDDAESGLRRSQRVKLSHAEPEGSNEVEMSLVKSALHRLSERDAYDLQDHHLKVSSSNDGYFMSGALNTSEDHPQTPLAAKAEAASSETPKTPASSSWGMLFNPVASVRRMFRYGAGQRTEPVRRTVNAVSSDAHIADDESGNFSPTSKRDKVHSLNLTPSFQDTSAMPPRRHRFVGKPQTPRLDYQIPLPDPEPQLPGSFLTHDEKPDPPTPPPKSRLPRHSFMPQSAPQPRRVQGSLQRRLQYQKQAADLEAKKAFEEKAQKDKEVEEESQRIRREAAKARSMHIPPEVIHASFVEKYGASARELQQQQEDGLNIGMKRKARDQSPEAIPNPPGTSYGLNDDYFDEDESALGDERGQDDHGSTNSTVNAAAIPSNMPLKSKDGLKASASDSPSIHYQFLGSPSRSPKRPRVGGSFESSDAKIRSANQDDHTEVVDSPTSKIRRNAHRNKSSMPQLQFRKDAATGAFEPIKAGSVHNSQEQGVQEDDANPHVSPWYSGPFTPSKRPHDSPADQLFKSRSVLSMKSRQDFKGDFVSDPAHKPNAFSVSKYQGDADDEDDDDMEITGQASVNAKMNQAARTPGSTDTTDDVDPIAFGKKYGCWTGAKGTGQFAVPESDSDSDEESEDSDLGNSNSEDFVTSIAKTPSAATSLEPNPALSTSNIFSRSLDAHAENPQAAQAQKSMHPEQSPKPSTETTIPPTTPGPKGPDALARARSQAEKYKPKTPSTLRAISAMSSPLASTRDETPGLAVEDEESGEDPGPATPRQSPPGLSTDPALQHGGQDRAVDGDGDEEMELDGPAERYAKDLANQLPVEELDIDQYSQWPSGSPPPWADEIDDDIQAALDAECDGPEWDAHCDGVWLEALETYMKEKAAAAAS